MTQYLPPNLLALFAPRDPVPYKPPLDRLPHEKKTKGYAGVGAFLGQFEDPKDTPPPTRVETREEKRIRKLKEKEEEVRANLQNEVTSWDPHSNTMATGDAFKSLFVARINYDTSESKLRREFESYGPIKTIHMVHNRENGKPRGYAFIEYEHERDMHSAYKYADGKKIDGRRVLVDVERARTVKDWLPRRLGGGLGGTRRGGPDLNIRHSGREEPSLAAAANKESMIETGTEIEIGETASAEEAGVAVGTANAKKGDVKEKGSGAVIETVIATVIEIVVVEEMKEEKKGVPLRSRMRKRKMLKEKDDEENAIEIVIATVEGTAIVTDAETGIVTDVIEGIVWRSNRNQEKKERNRWIQQMSRLKLKKD